MTAASVGEIAACAVRVPTDVVKQRAQASQATSSMAAVRAIWGLRREMGARGVWREMYRGWGITVAREVPFTVVQFPLWEGIKGWVVRRKRRLRGEGSKGGADVTAWESAAAGCVSGGVAAGATTPLDVVKTRIMLAEGRAGREVRVVGIMKDLVKHEGWRGLFAGLGPRVTWISVGGAVFLGSYQWAMNALGP